MSYEDTIPATAGAADLVEHEETALVAGHGTVGLAPIATQANAIEIIERQGALQQVLNLALVKQTEPEDWTASKAGDTIYCNPSGSATAKISRFLQIEIQGPNGEPRPLKEAVTRGTTRGFKVSFRCRSLVMASLSGLPPAMAPWTVAETTRWEDEDFTGRGVDTAGNLVKKGGVRALESDLSAAADKAAMNRAVGLLTGLRKIPLGLMERAFANEKILDRIPKGYGFGSSQERTGSRVAEEGVGEGAQALWEDCLRRTGGDEGAAHDLLREITSYPAGINQTTKKAYNAFGGVKSYQEITQKRGLDSARRKLQAHHVFGDNAAAQRDREPGED